MEFISAIELIKIQHIFKKNVDFTRMSKVRNALLLSRMLEHAQESRDFIHL